MKKDIRAYIRRNALIIGVKYDMEEEEELVLENELFFSVEVDEANAYLSSVGTMFYTHDIGIINGVTLPAEVLPENTKQGFIVVTDETLNNGVIIDPSKSSFDLVDTVEHLVTMQNISIENIFICYGQEIDTMPQIDEETIDDELIESVEKGVVQDVIELMRELPNERLVKYIDSGGNRD